MVATHCDPSGAYGTKELLVPNVSTATCSVVTPGAGFGSNAIRGAVVWLHGLNGPTSYIGTVFGGVGLTMTATLAADGWVSLGIPFPEDAALGELGVFNDVTNDTAGHGSRYLNTNLRLWTHAMLYIQATYPPNFPIVLFGLSWGGWHAFQYVANFQSTLLAYMIHIPATLLSTVNPTLFSGQDFGTLNTSGFDVTATQLNNATIPGIIGYGTSDNFVGYTGNTTIAAGSNGVDVSTFVGSQTLNIASSTNVQVGPSMTVTGLTGGTGTATFTFTGTGTGTLTGVTRLSGSGVLATGNPIVQSQTLSIITNQQAAQPSHQVSTNAVAQGHLFTNTDATTYANWIASNVDSLAPKIF